MDGGAAYDGGSNTVDAILNNVMYTSSFVRSIYLPKEGGNSWGSGLFNTSKGARYTLNEHDWYNDVVNNRKDDLWLPLQYDPFSGDGENTELVLKFVKPFRNLETIKTANPHGRHDVNKPEIPCPARNLKLENII